jgi:DNA-binding CsgD family transcriptional regulator
MYDPEVEDLIIDAWETTVRAKLERDPCELAMRVKRICGASLSRPPRAWCLGIRSCDQRLDRESGFDPQKPPDAPGAHAVFLDSPLLRKLCAPVDVPYGVTVREAAAMLGRFPEDLVISRIKGKLAVHHVAGLGGHRGRPVPVISSSVELDPSTRGFEMPDRVWGWTARWGKYGRVWDGFEQLVQRVPCYTDPGRAFWDKSELHPEHPAVDRVAVTRKSVNPRRLPPPAPDALAWYLWKGDEYIGYDWRRAERNPSIREDYERHERRKAQLQAYSKRRGRRPSRAKGGLWFRGWRWVCPACEKTVRMLFLPLGYINVLGGLLGDVVEAAVEQTDRPRQLQVYACAACHKVRVISRSNHNFWNAVIGYLTGGLMYGWEVPRPAWLTKDRKRAYVPKVHAKPAWRRAAVMELLLEGKTRRQIAVELDMSVRTVDCHVQRIYRQYHVRGREELMRKVHGALRHGNAQGLAAGGGSRGI